MFTLTIDTDNAAFDDDPGAEVARILRSVADRVDADLGPGPLLGGAARDVNGKTVGRWSFA